VYGYGLGLDCVNCSNDRPFSTCHTRLSALHCVGENFPVMHISLSLSLICLSLSFSLSFIFLSLPPLLSQIGVASRSTVPTFTPELRTSGLFPHSRSLQQLILTKIINGERASYHAPKFMRLTNRSRAQLLLELTESLAEYAMASKQGRATRKINRRSNWLPVGATRPPSPMLDSVHQKHCNSDQLAEDFQVAFRGCELADVAFIVGDSHTPLYAVKAILACRSRVFRIMFQEGQAQSPSRRFTSPMIRKRLPTASCVISPQGSRKLSHSGAKPKLALIKRKKSTQDLTRSASPDPPSFFFCEDPRNMNIKEQYIVEDFDNMVFGELLSYLMTGQCSIRPETVVGIACVAERFEVEELKQACLDNLPSCLTVVSICLILTQLEQYLSFAAAKTIVVQCLEFIDTNAAEILLSQQFLQLSENMVHLVLKRESSADLPEIMKVKAAFAWGELHSKPSGPDFKSLVTPLLKHIKLHLIDPQDIMKILVPSGIFDMDKLMAALAYQVDPQSVEVENYTMFRPRKKTNVLSSR
jgi:BTB/POZ domain-containing protein 9